MDTSEEPEARLEYLKRDLEAKVMAMMGSPMVRRLRSIGLVDANVSFKAKCQYPSEQRVSNLGTRGDRTDRWSM